MNTTAGTSTTERGDNVDVWETTTPKSHSKNVFKGARRLLTIQIPPSRRPHLVGIYSASSAVTSAVIVAAILTIADAVSKFCAPFIGRGILDIVLTLLTVYLATFVSNHKEAYEVRLLVFYMFLLICMSGTMLGLDVASYVKIMSQEYPDGCKQADPDFTPESIPTKCDRFQRLTIAGIVFMSMVFAAFACGSIGTLVLAYRLDVWQKAATPQKRSTRPSYHERQTKESSDPFDRFSTAVKDAPNQLEKEYLEMQKSRTAMTIPPLSLPPAVPSGSQTPSDFGPQTPVELYHLRDFQLEPGIGRQPSNSTKPY